jgi:hypothetical protein
MKNGKIFLVALAALVVFFGVMAPDVYGQQATAPSVLQLDPLVKQFEAREAGRTAQFGIEPNPPGGGGPAFFASNAKVPNDIRYEFCFYLNDYIDCSSYAYLTFDMMGDTWEIMNDINEHYPRFRKDDTFTQFQGSFLFRDQIDKVLDGKARTWITVSVPIARFNLHENRREFAEVMASTNIFLLRFITNRAPIAGKLYFRNIRLQRQQ